MIKKGGFTFVEFFVVIAIIGFICALFIPALQAARHAHLKNKGVETRQGVVSDPQGQQQVVDTGNIKVEVYEYGGEKFLIFTHRECNNFEIFLERQVLP
jgi:competence protein ComGC